MYKKIFLTIVFAMLFVASVSFCVPENVIIIVCDGMGLNHMYLSEIFAASEGLGIGTKEFNNIGLGINYTAESLVTDSAAAATAIFCGKKTNLGYLGIGPDGESLESLGVFFKSMGWSVAVITNTVYCDATPAAIYSHSFSRQDTEKITQDLVGNSIIDVLAAGGLEKLGVNPFTGKPTRNSGINVLAQNGYEVLGVDFRQIAFPEGVKKGTMAFVTLGDMCFEDKKNKGEPHFSQVVEKAFDMLPSGKNIFAMVECGRVDDACHINDEESVIAELVEFQRVLGMLLKRFPDENTLFVVLSDHETGGIFINGGYSDGTDIYFEWGSTDHTASYVPVLSKGEGSENFRGIYHIENIPCKIKSIFREEKHE